MSCEGLKMPAYALFLACGELLRAATPGTKSVLPACSREPHLALRSRARIQSSPGTWCSSSACQAAVSSPLLRMFKLTLILGGMGALAYLAMLRY